MASRPLISINLDVSSMRKALAGAPKAVRKGTTNAIKKLGDKAFRRIKNRTPVGRTHKARSGWKREVTRKGMTYSISNDVDYINVLEFGGYPVRARSRVKQLPSGSFRRGRAILGGKRPGPNTMKAPRIILEPPAKPAGRGMNSNVSRQAPLGMLRITFAEIEPEFAKDLEFEIDKAFAKLER